jgi:hypothetical protein
MPNQECPIQPEFNTQMNAIAAVLDETFNGSLRGEDRNVGFALLVFNLQDGADKRANYICNCRREDMLAAMKEFIARNEGRYMEGAGATL